MDCDSFSSKRNLVQKLKDVQPRLALRTVRLFIEQAEPGPHVVHSASTSGGIAMTWTWKLIQLIAHMEK